MSNFHDIQFPCDLTDGRGGQGYRGGPMFSTAVAISESGKEQRNMNWMRAMNKYNVGHILRDEAATATLLDFFNGRMGMLYGFRFKDWLDYRVPDVNDGEFTTLGSIWSPTGSAPYQTVKTYTDVGGYVHMRLVSKLCSGLVEDASGHTPPVPQFFFNGVLGVLGTDYDIDYNSGLFWPAYDVGLNLMTTPLSGWAVTWAGEFDVPVRFETDLQQLLLQEWSDTDWPSIQLGEIKMQAFPIAPIITPPPSTVEAGIVTLWPQDFECGVVMATARFNIWLNKPPLTDVSVSLVSTNTSVATVGSPVVISGTGGISMGTALVTLVAAGTTEIQATLNGVTVTATLVVL